MKFIQGDAIAGIIIIFINIIGGLYLGVSRGMELGLAAQTYTILTVGDGLVSQIPALLISICSGIVVTRVSSNDGLTLGNDLSLQLFANPVAIVVTGVLLMILGVLPGIPFLPFFGVGIFFVGFGVFIKPRMLQVQELGAVVDTNKNILRLPHHKEKNNFLEKQIEESKAPLKLMLGRHAYDLMKSRFEGLTLWWQDYSDRIFNELGVVLPPLHLERNTDSASLQMKVTGYDISFSESLSAFDVLWIPFRKNDAKALGFELLEGRRIHPVSGVTLSAVIMSPETNRLLESLSVKGIDSLQYLMLRSAAEMLATPANLVSFESVVNEMKAFESRTAGLKSDTLQRFFISPPKLYQLLCSMVRERLAIRDMSTIVQSVSEFCVAHKISSNEDTDVSIKPLLDHLRRKLSKKITQPIMEREIKPIIFALNDSLVGIFERASLDEFSRHVHIVGDQTTRIISTIARLKERLLEKGTESLRIIVSEEVRLALRIFLEMNQQDIGVEVLRAKEFESHHHFLVGGIIGVDTKGGV